MEWTDSAIILSVRRHGESAALASLLTAAHGRHAGLVHGGASRASRGMLQPGNLVSAHWRGRLAEQLGTFKLEPVADHAGRLMGDAGKLAALASACALCQALLPEREPHPAIHDALVALLDALAAESWPSVYVHWELALLRDLGYGLDLSCCAATGEVADLAWVSPKTGRAVSAMAGAPYADKLLALPSFLVAGGEGDRNAVRAGLKLVEFFLERNVLGPQRIAMPASRSRLVDRLGS